MDDGLRRKGKRTINRTPRTLFTAAFMALLAGSIGVWIAMHRNLYGTGGHILPFYESIWARLAAIFHLAGSYPPERWANGFVLRPAFTIYAVGYGLLLLTLRYFRWGQELRMKTLFIVTVIVALPFILMPYIMSSDLFDYTSYARLWVLHNSNPYSSSISEFPEDPLFAVTCWKSASSVYGPAYTLLTVGFVHFAEAFGGSLTLYMLIHKTAMFLFQLGSGVLIWKILSKAGAKDRAFKTALFLLNPLVMLEFPGNGHNEAMMITFLLAAIHLGQENKNALAAVCFAFAVQTKLYCLPMFIFFIVYRCWKAESLSDAARRVMALAGVFAVVNLILFIPFGLNETTLLAPIAGPGGSSMTKSLGDYLAFKAPFQMKDLPFIGIFFRGDKVSDLRRFALLLTAAVCVAGAFRSRTLSQAVSSMSFFALFWCLVGATWFMPWYITLAVAMAAITPSRSTAWASSFLSFTVFIIYLLEGWNFSTDPDFHNYMVGHFEIFVFLPPMIFIAAFHAWRTYGARKRIDTLRTKIYGS